MDRFGEKTDSKFRYVLLAAQRADQLIRGAKPRVEVKSPKTACTAMEEVSADLVTWDYGPAPEPVIDLGDLELSDSEGERSDTEVQ